MAPRRHIPVVEQNQFWHDLYEKAGEHRVPLRATFELTYGCNLRCVHCYNPTHQAKGELTTEQIKAILDQLAEEGCIDLEFTGGETFTRRDCFEIFTYAKAKGFALTLLTNASLITPERADRLQALRPKLVEISIFGATRESYEGITRIPGSFPLFLRGVRLLRERNVPLLIKMPVMTLNRHEVEQAKALVQRWGVKFLYCTEIHQRVDGSLEPLQYRLAPDEVIRVDAAMVRHPKRHGQGESDKGESCQTRSGLFTCACGRCSLAVTPYGRMNLCVSLPIPGYDLRSGTVVEGWKTLVDLVDAANANPGKDYACPTCDFQTSCRQGPMDAWLETQRLEPCLPYFKELATLEKATDEAGDPSQHQTEGAGCNGCTRGKG